MLFKRDVDNSVLFDFFRRRPGSELAWTDCFLQSWQSCDDCNSWKPCSALHQCYCNHCFHPVKLSRSTWSRLAPSFSAAYQKLDVTLLCSRVYEQAPSANGGSRRRMACLRWRDEGAGLPAALAAIEAIKGVSPGSLSKTSLPLPTDQHQLDEHINIIDVPSSHAGFSGLSL